MNLTYTVAILIAFSACCCEAGAPKSSSKTTDKPAAIAKDAQASKKNNKVENAVNKAEDVKGKKVQEKKSEGSLKEELDFDKISLDDGDNIDGLFDDDELDDGERHGQSHGNHNVPHLSDEEGGIDLDRWGDIEGDLDGFDGFDGPRHGRDHSGDHEDDDEGRRDGSGYGCKKHRCGCDRRPHRHHSHDRKHHGEHICPSKCLDCRFECLLGEKNCKQCPSYCHFIPQCVKDHCKKCPPKCRGCQQKCLLGQANCRQCEGECIKFVKECCGCEPCPHPEPPKPEPCHIVNGEKCDKDPSVFYCADQGHFARCVYGSWVVQSCAPGTSCKDGRCV